MLGLGQRPVHRFEDAHPQDLVTFEVENTFHLLTLVFRADASLLILARQGLGGGADLIRVFVRGRVTGDARLDEAVGLIGAQGHGRATPGPGQRTLIHHVPRPNPQRTDHQASGGGPEPNALLAPHRLAEHLGRQQAAVDRRHAQALRGQAIRGAEREDVFHELGRPAGLGRAEPLEAGGQLDRQAQVLLKKLLQPGQLERVAHADAALKLGVSVRGRVEADGPLNFGDQIGEDRPHGLEDLPGVLAAGRGAFEAFGLGE